MSPDMSSRKREQRCFDVPAGCERRESVRRRGYQASNLPAWFGSPLS